MRAYAPILISLQIIPIVVIFLFSGQVGNVITNRNASRLEFERLLVSE
ncbi:cyclic nucleotide-gated olfactory channel-like [Tropilaelaps mercedesae]|uniref:Cyclic nucleotide-gated olfactory channel-like n=1 Tax=Tropilaelaps mercedesae TaxID=418985 RepID=A0A1V9XFU8_9ACAR|nr:cyclic nucleotide-gated olfactory channel-like [Tropilaelaps mercedesae]